MAVGDFNDDGLPDIVTANRVDRTVSAVGQRRRHFPRGPQLRRRGLPAFGRRGGFQRRRLPRPGRGQRGRCRRAAQCRQLGRARTSSFALPPSNRTNPPVRK
jgi:hypothetical protein